MNCSLDEAKQLTSDIINAIDAHKFILDLANVVICPSALYMPAVRHTSATTDYITFGAQDCSAHDKGAFTGEISAEMLKESGCSYVIVGHSERRQYHYESDQNVAAKAKKAHENKLTAIICVGETESQRDAGQEEDVIRDQLLNSLPGTAHSNNTIIAYEPIWAIGTGKTASPEDVRKMHDFIRKTLRTKYSDAEEFPILYGGSVKPDNAHALFSIDNVNGALIGGASLQAESFIGIAKQS